jgi:signal transduction histidine kinase/DNA-binding response OmpR family regulator/PAS domain-containing protein
MTSPSELSDFLARLSEKHSRLTAIAASEASPDISELMAEIADLGEQLLVADEELRAQHEQLAESRSKLEVLTARNEQLFDAAPQALVITDSYGIVLDVNRAASALLAEHARPGARHPITSLFAAEDRRLVRTLITRVRSDGEPQQGELQLATPATGATLLVQVQAFRHALTDQQLLRWELSPTVPALTVLSTPETERDSGTSAAEPFAGDDETMTLLRGWNWSETSLGPVDQWPAELLAAVRTVLASKVPMLIWWGPELIQLYNDAYRPFLGDKHPEAIGQPAAQCWAEIWSAIGPRAASVLAGEGASYFENDLLFIERTGYQEETYWTYSYSPISSASGEVLGIFVATTDVTQRQVGARRMRMIGELGALSATESGNTCNVSQLALRILESGRSSVPFAAVYVLAEDGGVRLQASYGVSASGPRLPAAVTPSDDSPISRALRTGTAELIDPAEFAPGCVFLTSPLGPARPQTIRLMPIWLSGRAEPQALLAVGLNPYRAVDEEYLRFLDLAARQLGIALSDAAAYDAEHQRAEAYAVLDQAKTRFFENISHEFRTPLTLMMAPIEALLSDPQVHLPLDRRAEVASARRAVLRLNRLVDTLLDFARAEADELHADLEITDLAQLTTDVASMFRAVVEEAGLSLDIDTAAVTAPVAVDTEMVNKILLNLLSNAVKFTQQGSISVRLEEGGDEVRLTVADTGLGIPAEELSRVFERFHQVPVRGARSREGAGIGLSLVRDLARAHGGEVSVRSELGSGSQFTVRLPRVQSGLRRPAAGHSSTAAPAYLAEAHTWSATSADQVLAGSATQDASELHDPAVLPAGRVLLVEDNLDMRDYLSRLLRADGWQVEAVGTVEEALAASAVPDLVLSDVMLPDRSGIELVKLMRGSPALARIPAVLLTARAGAASASEGLRAGADDYIVKPFAANELLARVRTHYELARLREYALNRAEDKAANLERALSSNRQIGAAMGILMARLQLTDEQAFDLLRKTSQNRHRKLRDIAEEVLMTGEVPAIPAPHTRRDV